IWELPRLELHATMNSHEMLIGSIAFSPDSTTLISAGAERTVRQWNVATGQEPGAPRGLRGSASFCSYCAGGGPVVAASFTGEIKLWSIPARVDLPEMRLGASENSAFALSRDGRRAALADIQGELIVLDAEQLAVVSRFKPHVGPIYGLEFSPDGATL